MTLDRISGVDFRQCHATVDSGKGIYHLQNMLQKKTILHIDNDPDDLFLIDDHIRLLCPDIMIRNAFDGAEGLARLNEILEDESLLPGLVLMDLNMPGLSGWDVLESIGQLAKSRDIPVIVFSTSANPADIEFCHLHGAAYMVKPIDYYELKSQIAKILSMAVF